MLETAELTSDPVDPWPTTIIGPLRDEDALICIRGRCAGERVDRKSREVKADPSRFVPVVPDGNLTSDNALVALESMVSFDEDGTARRLHKGQWCARTDPFVTLHPAMFAAPLLEED